MNKCEGVLAHDVHNATIRNNTFTNVPDAIEFINSNDGLIEFNSMIGGNDDGVDLNSCTDMIIRNNYFASIGDSALEIGSENFGRTINAMVEHNKIENCHKGIWLKESSTTHALQDTFINCNIAVDVITPADSIDISSIVLEKCQFVNNGIDVQEDDRSEVEVIN